MACSYADCQGIDASLGNEVLDFFRLCVVGDCRAYLIFDAGKNSKLTFYSYIELVGILYDFLCKSNVFFIWKG